MVLSNLMKDQWSVSSQRFCKHLQREGSAILVFAVLNDEFKMSLILGPFCKSDVELGKLVCRYFVVSSKIEKKVVWNFLLKYS